MQHHEVGQKRETFHDATITILVFRSFTPFLMTLLNFVCGQSRLWKFLHGLVAVPVETVRLEHSIHLHDCNNIKVNFYETKQIQHEVRRFLLQLVRICFRILLQQSENFSDFCKGLSQFAFRNMIVPFPKSQTRHPARARAPLTLPHGFFFDEKSFTKSFPSSHLLPRKLAKTLQVLIYDSFVSVGRSTDFDHERKTTN